MKWYLDALKQYLITKIFEILLITICVNWCCSSRIGLVGYMRIHRETVTHTSFRRETPSNSFIKYLLHTDWQFACTVIFSWIRKYFVCRLWLFAMYIGSAASWSDLLWYVGKRTARIHWTNGPLHVCNIYTVNHKEQDPDKFAIKLF